METFRAEGKGSVWIEGQWCCPNDVDLTFDPTATQTLSVASVSVRLLAIKESSFVLCEDSESLLGCGPRWE